MLPRGIPETPDEAREINAATAAITHNTPSPSHWPHSQVVALSQLVDDLLARIERLEAKPRRGRPPKNRSDDTDGLHEDDEHALAAGCDASDQ